MTERGENEVEAGLKRAQETCRAEDYEGAIKQSQSLHREYPKSRHAPAALWEAASIYYSHQSDLERATQVLGELIIEYPTSPLAKDARLRLAEIHKADDRDLDRAVEYWERALERNLSPKERRHVAFKLGDTHLKQRRLEDARGYLQEGGAAKADDRLGQQALIRPGTIAQIRFFEATMASEECQECRAQAIAIPEAIPREKHPKEELFLLERVEVERDR